MYRLWSDHVFDSLNNGHFEFSDNPVTATFKTPGLAPVYFSRFGEWNKIDMRNLMVYFTECRNLPFLTNHGRDGTNFLDFPKFYEGSLLFVGSSKMQMTKNLYDRTIPKWPLKVTLSLGYVGSSSMSLVNTLSAPGSNVPLASQISTIVLIDKETRRPKPIPDWFKEKYGGKGAFTTPNRVETLSKPKETFHFKTEVLWSDTDRNNHANYSTYVHYTLNALRAAVRRQAAQDKQQSSNKLLAGQSDDIDTINGLNGINVEIIDSGVKSLEVCYDKESKEGDALDIYLWQEETDRLKVKAVVEHDGDTLCHIHLDFFDIPSLL